MNDSVLSVTVKTRLTDYAREVVARNARAGAANPEPATRVEPVDAFSPEGLRLRLALLEKEFGALDRRIEQNLSAILTAMQRIEARASQTSGELRAVREELDARTGDVAYARDELTAIAKEYGAALMGEITRLADRVDEMNETTVAETPGARHEG